MDGNGSVAVLRLGCALLGTAVASDRACPSDRHPVAVEVGPIEGGEFAASESHGRLG